MKAKSLLFAIVAFLFLCVSSSYAANVYGPFWITKCNVLPDNDYASVYINDDYPIPSRSDTYHYLVTVYPNESILIPESNYGIQSFGLNYAHDPTQLSVFVLKSATDDTVDTNWKITFNALSSFGPFGVFVYNGDTTGKYRKNPLRIYIGSEIPLTYTDFYVPNESMYMFACHIAGFKDMGDGITEITSAKFALPFPTLIELSFFNAKPGNKSVTLNWATEVEIDNAGFNIYRADVEDGIYVKINDSLISAKGSSMEGALYTFIDKTVKNRRVYYYKLEDVDLDGISTIHGPVSAMPRYLYGILK